MVALQKIEPFQFTHLNQSRSEASWCLSDLAYHRPDKIVISGSEHKSQQTFVSLFEVEVCGDDDVKAVSVFRKELNRQPSAKVFRLVSFIDDSTLVTCLDDTVEKISVTSRDIIHSKKLSFGGASCVAVKNEEIFIGSSGSSAVTVLSLQLLQTRVINLEPFRNGWPIDLEPTSDTAFICAVGGECRNVMSIEEKSGEYLILVNPSHREAVPLSITVCKEADVVAVSWNDPAELTIHSLSAGFCLVVADIELVERVRSLGKGQLGTIDAKGEFKIFLIAQLFTFGNLKALLSNLLSQSDCQQLKKLLKMNNESQDKIESPSKCNEKTFVELLEEKGHFNSENINSLRDAIKAGDFSETGQRVVAAIGAYHKFSGGRRNLFGKSGAKKRAADGTEDDKEGKKLKTRDGGGEYFSGLSLQYSDIEHPAEVAASDLQRCREVDPQQDGEVESLTGSGSLGGLSHSIVSEFRSALVENITPLLNEIRGLKNELAKIKTLNEIGQCHSSCGGGQSCSNHMCLRPCAAHSSNRCSHVHSNCSFHGCCQANSHHIGNPAAPQTNRQAQAATAPPASSSANLGQTLTPSGCSQPNMMLPFTHPLVNPQYLPGTFVPMQYSGLQQTMQPNQPLYFGSPNSLQHISPNVVNSHQPLSQTTGMMSTPVRSTTFQPEGDPMATNHNIANTQPQTTSTNVLNLSVNHTSNPSNASDKPLEDGKATPAKASSKGKRTASRVLGFRHALPNEVYLGTTAREAEETAAAVKACLQSSSHPTSCLNGFPTILRKELLQYKDQDDPKAREQIVKVMLRTLFTQEERAHSNCGGKGGYRQIHREKLYLVKEIVFLVCPCVGGKDDEQTRAKEWKRLCTYIDNSNRHLRFKFRQWSRREESRS